MRRAVILSGATLLLLSAVALLLLPEDPFYLGGIQVNEPDHLAWTKALAASGFNTVSVTVYARQGDWDSSNLWFEEEEPWVVSEARAAKQQGLAVVLILRVALDHAFDRNKFFWHGMIMPPADEEVRTWFERYSRFAVHWAKLAEELDIDVLAISSELNSMTNTAVVDEIPGLEEYWSNDEKVTGENERILAFKDRIEGRGIWVRGNEDYRSLDRFLEDRSAAHAAWARQLTWQASADPVAAINARRRLLADQWRTVVEKVRRVYSGELTYAANFDQYEQVEFWDALDLIGINAYFPLRRRGFSEGGNPHRKELFRARWESILREIDGFRQERNVPEHRLVFTELGYVRRKNCTIEPWAAHGFSVLSTPSGPELMVWEDQPLDLDERADAIQGLYEANAALGGRLLAGILYWKLSTEPTHREVEPFVMLIGPHADEDPMRDALRKFTERLPWIRRQQRLTDLLP